MDSSLMNMLRCTFVKCTYRTCILLGVACYGKCVFSSIYTSSVSTGFARQIMSISPILCYNGSLVTWTVVSLTTAKFKPLICCVSRFVLSYTTDMFILMILYDFCLVSRSCPVSGGKVSTEPFPSNGCCTIACLHSSNLALGLHVPVG
jgi:hypothetical protein